ncbi:MAG: pentapeptide repeat-containing protein [Proteobacteria bacterium]|nr:pentapeptide repeat-containing protein [Pseudomonadota bacterium]
MTRKSELLGVLRRLVDGMTRKSVLLAVLLLLVAAGAIAAALTAPPIFSFVYWQEGDDSTSRSEVFRNLGLAGIAFGALIVGSIRALSAHRQARAASEQARIAEQGQFTERFSRAAEQLGSPALPVRLGGIYALWRLAEDSSLRDLISVIDILCAFVRHPPHEPAEPKDKADKEDDADTVKYIRPDVQTVLHLIGGTDSNYRQRLPDDYHLDLTYADLDFAKLRGADLSGANLGGVNLIHADLTLAILRGADLDFANFRDAILRGADLRGAIVARTHPRGADLDAGDHLRDIMANLIFADADLTGADLTDVKNLTQSQVDLACCDPDDPPVLPPGLTPPRQSPKRRPETAPPPEA